MMAFKLIALLVVACLLAETQGATIRKSAEGERIAALYVKDNSNGELRFLGSGFGGTSNAQLNQFITQKQDMLEQMRPTGSSSGSGTASTGSGFGTGSGSGSITPIVVNTGSTSSTSTNNGISSSVINSSPISGVLPNIIAQAVFARGSPNNNRRRVVNQRRRNNRRKSGRRGNKNKPNIYVVRP